MGECRECEAALVCRDFLRLGYSKLVLDPGVRLAYSADVARQRYTRKVPQLWKGPLAERAERSSMTFCCESLAHICTPRASLLQQLD